MLNLEIRSAGGARGLTAIHLRSTTPINHRGTEAQSWNTGAVFDRRGSYSQYSV